MKHILVTAVFMFLISTTGFAQSADGQNGQGYAFFAPSVAARGGAGLMHTGGGGEALIKRVGIGGELGYLTPWESLSSGLGVGSLNGSFNLKPGKISPFVTGGYTLFFRTGTANGISSASGLA